MPVAAPADKRFRRAHVKPARRRRPWSGRGLRILRALLVLAVVGYAAHRVTRLAAEAKILQVGRIVVRGNERLSNGEVLALLDGLQGHSILTVDLERWRSRLLHSPWVADAALRRTLPSTVEVFVSERQPMGIGRIGQELYLVDPRGMIIDEYGPNYADYDLPIIDGLAASPARDGTLIDATRAGLAARLLQAVRPRPELARRISQIDVTDARDAVVILEGDSALIRLGDDQFLERLQSYLELAPALRERVPDIDYVDLRFDERVYVRPVTDRDAPRSMTGLAAQAVAPPGRF